MKYDKDEQYIDAICYDCIETGNDVYKNKNGNYVWACDECWVMKDEDEQEIGE